MRLEDDFEVGPGPKFHVYLVPEADVRPGTNVEETMFVDLGRLKAFTGSQNYRVPTGVNPRDYQSVVIWWRAVQRVDFAGGHCAGLGTQSNGDLFANVRQPIAGL